MLRVEPNSVCCALTLTTELKTEFNTEFNIELTTELKTEFNTPGDIELTVELKAALTIALRINAVRPIAPATPSGWPPYRPIISASRYRYRALEAKPAPLR